jgi:hypothetical protein
MSDVSAVTAQATPRAKYSVLWGAKAIGAYCGVTNKRQAHHLAALLVAEGVATKVGPRKIAARTDRLDERFHGGKIEA